MKEEKSKKTKSPIKKFLNEFSKFAIKGNAFELAVGVVVGAAFKDVISAIVEHVIMPPISFVTNKVDFSQRYINLSGQNFENLSEAEAAGALIIKYGVLVNALIDFIIIAIVIFIVVRWLNKVTDSFKGEEKKKVKKRKCQYCYSEVHKKAVKCPNCTSSLKSK